MKTIKIYSICLVLTFLFLTNSVFAQELYKPSIKKRTAQTYELESEKGKVKVNVQNVGGAIILGGDIVLKPANISQAIGIRKFLRWKDGIIRYKLPDNHPSRNTILSAINTLNRNTVLWYRPVDRNYNGKFINITYGDGCYSGIGEPFWGDSHEVSIGMGCDYGRALHELLHTAGLFHEQQREDRDRKVKILWDNIEENKKSNFEKDPWFSKEIGDYNFASIMHYGCFDFSKNGLKTIESRIAAIGQRSGLSPGDISAIRAMYYNIPDNRGKPNLTPEPLPTLQYSQACIPPPLTPSQPANCETMRQQMAGLQEDYKNETNPTEKQNIRRQITELRNKMRNAGCA